MFEYAKIRFNNYINENYDLENDIVKRKLKHTYNVVKMAEYISEDLSLSDEDKELSMVIALLHDIGRFAQTKLGVNNLLEATKKVNHAALGVKMLFDDNLIREFIKSDKYDEIIKIYLENDVDDNTELVGNIAYPGNVTGRVVLVFGEKDIKKYKENDIIVSPMTTPKFSNIISSCKAIITDEGGEVCHAAIVARELKIPCVVGCKRATKVLKDGDIVTIKNNKIIKQNI